MGWNYVYFPSAYVWASVRILYAIISMWHHVSFERIDIQLHNKIRPQPIPRHPYTMSLGPRLFVLGFRTPLSVVIYRSFHERQKVGHIMFLCPASQKIPSQSKIDPHHQYFVVFCWGLALKGRFLFFSKWFFNFFLILFTVSACNIS